MSERRQQARVPVERSFSESDPRTLTPVSNLSRGGVFVHTDILFAVGARILLRFVVIPEDPALFEHTGIVRRHQKDPLGMGVEFDPLPLAQQQIVDRVLARAERQAAKRGRRSSLAGRQLIDTSEFRVQLAPD